MRNYITERGNWTAVPNELFDVLLKDLSGSEYKVFSVIHRLTIGFNKKRDQVTYQQLQERTGLSVETISHVLYNLQANQLISKNKRGYEINWAEILRFSESLASKKIPEKSDINPKKSESRLRKSESAVEAKDSENLISKRNQRNTNKKETPTKEEPPATGRLQAPAGWLEAVQDLVDIGFDKSMVIAASWKALDNGWNSDDISKANGIAGYVVSQEAKSTNPGKLAKWLIDHNEKRRVETAQEPPRSRQEPPKASNQVSGAFRYMQRHRKLLEQNNE
jgi:phage replication O-like protein O